VIEYLKRRLNHLQVGRLHRQEDEYALFNDTGHDYAAAALLHRPGSQQRQLDAAGLRLLEVIDSDGRQRARGRRGCLEPESAVRGRSQVAREATARRTRRPAFLHNDSRVCIPRSQAPAISSNSAALSNGRRLFVARAPFRMKVLLAADSCSNASVAGVSPATPSLPAT